MKKRILTVALIAVAVVVGMVIAKRNSDQKPVQTLSFAKPRRGPIWIKVSATGVIEPVKVVEVKSKASGIVIELGIEEGDRVVKGEVIARLDSVEIHNELRSQRAALDVASQSVRVQQKELERAEKLAQDGLISPRQLEIARLDFERAKAEEINRTIAIANLEERLRDTVIRAPIDGIVLEKFVEVGQVISSGVSSVTGGTPIAMVADISSVLVKIDVDETDVGRVRVGQTVKVVPDAFPDQEFQGRVERISPRAKLVQNVTTFEVITLVENPDLILKPGMNATAEVIVDGKQDALLVPSKAVRDASEIQSLAQEAGISVAMDESLRGSAVLVKHGNELSVKQVTVGLSDWTNTEIVEGLQEGEEVAVFLTSRALQQSRDFVERRKQTAIPGMRR